MLVDEIGRRWLDAQVPSSSPLLQVGQSQVTLDDIVTVSRTLAAEVPPQSVVAIIGDFSPRDIATLLHLVDLGCIVAPLTTTTEQQHEFFLEALGAEIVVRGGVAYPRPRDSHAHPLIARLREEGKPGLVLFTSGTTGAPKAILHDFTNILDKFRAYHRPALRTLAFLLFDHIGGINTLFHTLFNAGTIHVPRARRPQAIARQIEEERINLLPTTPTFLRLALMEHALENADLSSLRLVTYGTEPMDLPTLERVNDLLPEHVDVRQTYGMSELGIFPVHNRSKRELWLRMADALVETEVRDGVLWIRSPYRMLGYLNAPSPFDAEDWYNTRDLVELEGDYFRIVGRTDDVINVGGIKIQPRDVEEAAYLIPEVVLARASGEKNPLLGEHIRLDVQLRDHAAITKKEFRSKLAATLDRDKMPHRIEFHDLEVSSRFKTA